MARDKKSPGKIDRLIDELMEDGVDALRIAAVRSVPLRCNQPSD